MSPLKPSSSTPRRRNSTCGVLVLLILYGPSNGQPSSCAPGMAFNPDAPNASQLVTITVGEQSDIPVASPIVTVEGTTIRVAVTRHADPVCGQSFCWPPIVCATTSIGPLLPGTYATRLDVTNTLDGTSFSAFDKLIVGPSVAVVPTTSAASVAALALILFACTLWTRRRKRE
jgi:hypothetical protein